MTAMDKLRAELMRTRQFNWWERKELRWLSPKSEEQRQVVMAALGPDHELTPRMIRCGEVNESKNMFYCGMPLCPRCFMRERGRQTRQAIRETFVGADNADMVFVTILLPVRTGLVKVHDVIEREKRRLRNFVVRQRHIDPRWNDFNMVGFWEMGRMTFGDFQNAGRKTKLALKNLGFPYFGADDEAVWLPHLHAIVHKGQLTEKEIAKALRNDGHHAPYQVDVQRFHTYRSLTRNLQNVTRYSLKFRIEEDADRADALDYIATDADAAGTRNWWPAKDIKAYAEWLCLERPGFQSLRFVLGKGNTAKTSDIAADLSAFQEENVAVSSDRFASRGVDEGVLFDKDDVEYKAHGIFDEDVDVLFDIKSHLSDGEGYVGCSVRYNNLLLDTNWIKMRKNHPVSAVSKYAGGVQSLNERLRILGLLELREPVAKNRWLAHWTQSYGDPVLVENSSS